MPMFSIIDTLLKDSLHLAIAGYCSFLLLLQSNNNHFIAFATNKFSQASIYFQIWIFGSPFVEYEFGLRYFHTKYVVIPYTCGYHRGEVVLPHFCAARALFWVIFARMCVSPRGGGGVCLRSWFP